MRSDRSRPDILDAEFTVVTPARAVAPRSSKKRPYGTEGWPEAEYQVWLQQPWWKRYRLGWNWPIAISSGLIALSIAIRELAK